jgi:hypothetical protein
VLPRDDVGEDREDRRVSVAVAVHQVDFQIGPVPVHQVFGRCVDVPLLQVIGHCAGCCADGQGAAVVVRLRHLHDVAGVLHHQWGARVVGL